MKPYYYWITHDWEKDIDTDREKLAISRQVFWWPNMLEDKETILNSIPYASVLESLQAEFKERTEILLDYDEDCMTDINWLNME